MNWRILLVFSKNTAGLGSGSPPRIDQSVVFVEDFQDLVQLCLNIVVEDIPTKALMPNSVQLYQKTSNNSATTTIKHLSLYEHPRRQSTSENLTILKALVPNFSLATPNKNHGWVTLILYEHPRRPSTTETLTIFWP